MEAVNDLAIPIHINIRMRKIESRIKCFVEPPEFAELEELFVEKRNTPADNATD